MRRGLWGLVLVLVLVAGPVWGQVPDGSAVARAVAGEGWFAKCEAGERRGCSLFAREVARRLNPSGDPAGWGWLSKAPGETGVDGFAEDAIVFSSDAANLRNVVDLVVGAGAPGARVGWSGPQARRPSNVWVRPEPLSAADMAYLGVSGGGSGGGGGGGGGGGSDPALVALTATVARLEATLAGVVRTLWDVRAAGLEARDQASMAAARSAAALEGLARLEARPVVGEWPEYRGRVLGFGVTLRPTVREP